MAMPADVFDFMFDDSVQFSESPGSDECGAIDAFNTPTLHHADTHGACLF